MLRCAPPSRRTPWSLWSLPRLLLALLLVPLAVVGVGSTLGAASAVTPSCSTAGYTVTGLGGPNFYIDSSDTTMRSAYTGYRVVNATGAPVDDLYVGLSQFTGGAVGLGAGQTPAQRLGDLAVNGGQSLFWYLTATGATATAQNHTLTIYRHDPALSTATPLCTMAGGFTSVQTTISANANKVTNVTVTGGTPKLGSTFTITVTGDTGTIGAGVTGDTQSFWMTPAVAASWPASSFRLLSTTITMPDSTGATQTWNDLLRVANLGSSSRSYTATYTFRAIGFTTSASTLQPIQQIASGTQIKHTGSVPATIPAIPPPVNDLSMTVAASPTRLDTGGGDVTYTGTVAGSAGSQLDGFDLILPTDATPVPGSVTWAGQPAPDPVLVDGTWRVSGPFTVPAGGGALKVKVHHGPTTGARKVTIRGIVGSSYIGSTVTVVDGSNAAGATVQVNRPPAATGGTASVDGEGNASFAVASIASDSDGDPLTLTDVSAPSGAASIVGNEIRFQGVPDSEGTPVAYTVSDGRGGTATGSVTVFPRGAAAPEPQTIDAPGSLTVPVGGQVPVGASATSGLDPRYEALTTDTCSVDESGLVTAVAVGECSISVTQPGNATYAAAPARTVAITIGLKSQTITTAEAPATVPVGDTVPVTAAASSGLAPHFRTTTPTTCAADGEGVVTGLAAGTCAIEVSQPGDDVTWAAAPARPVSIQVEGPVLVPDPELLPQTVDASVPAPASVPVDGQVQVDASASSGLDPVFGSATEAVCSVSGTGLVTGLAPGTCTIEVSQPGDATYAAAPLKTVDLTVEEPALPADQTLVFDETVPTALPADGTVTIPVSATSGLTPVFASTTPQVCTVDAAGVVTPLQAGVCRIAIDQVGDESFNAAPQVVVELTVTALAQHLTGHLANPLTVGDHVTATAAASSGLPVAWGTASPQVCTVDPTGVVSAVGAGQCRITVGQAGGGRYAAAVPIELVATVSAVPVTPIVPVAQTITLVAPDRVLAGPAPIGVTWSTTSGLPVALTVEGARCTLDHGALVASGAGTCTLVARQSGNASYLPATAVRAVVEIVLPADDTIAVPAAARTPMAVDVLGNDPSGLTVVAVGAAGHGRASVVDGTVRYLPDAGYRGADRFAYTVRDAHGRTAEAHVSVTVANAVPTVAASGTSQLAGSTARVPVRTTDGNGDALVVTASADVAGVTVAVRGGQVVVTPGLAVSGLVRVTVTVVDGVGGVATTTFLDRVSPRPVASAERYLTKDGTRVSWSAAPTAGARYDVVVGGRVVCRTAALSCRLDRIVGPAISTTVVVRGKDGTRSTERATRTTGSHRVLMATVYFRPDDHTLNDAQRRSLERISERILRLGFRKAELAGYTDSDGAKAYNVRLSHRRTRTVADLLGERSIRSTQSWYGMDDPAASNTTQRGKAANRRVEIYVGF